MKSKIKKGLCLLVLSLALVCFAGCSKRCALNVCNNDARSDSNYCSEICRIADELQNLVP
jgi:hypothetical protein